MRRFALYAIGVYQRDVAHRLNVSCALEPSCSEYARASFATNGTLRATRQTIRRLQACRDEARRATDM